MTPAARASPTTSPRSTAPPTATAPTGSTWRPPPTHRRPRQRPRLDRGRAVVQLHRQRRHRRHLHDQPAAGRRPAGSPTRLHIANTAGDEPEPARSPSPATGGYQTWTTVIASVTLPAGIQTLTVDQDNGGWNIHFLAFGLDRRAAGRPARRSPYGGHRGGGAGHRAGGKLRHRRAGRRLQRHLGQRLAPTATAPTGSTWRPPPTPAAATTSAGPRPGSGSSTPSTSPRPAPTPSSLRLAAPTAVTDALHIDNAPGPT